LRRQKTEIKIIPKINPALINKCGVKNPILMIIASKKIPKMKKRQKQKNIFDLLIN